MTIEVDPQQTQQVAPVSSGGEHRAFGGLLVRKESWRLSGLGRLIVAIAAAGLVTWIFLGIFPFLAITARVDTDTLVVEGWVHKAAIRMAVQEFKSGSYQHLFTTGGPVVGNGGYVNDYQTAASVGADLLKKFGVPAESVQMVPSREMDRDRTYSSAVALRNWFRDHDIRVRSFDILTEDLHARRTRLLFQEAFGDTVKVGIISIPNPDYDQKHWWRYSEGVESALGETVAYLYAKFFFWPASPKDETTGQRDNKTMRQRQDETRDSLSTR